MEEKQKKDIPSDYIVKQFEKYDGYHYEPEFNVPTDPKEKIKRQIKLRIPGFSRTESNQK